jgi:hypothetical protein
MSFTPTQRLDLTDAKPGLTCATGHELIQRGHRVLFVDTFALVQRLLAAKRDLRLEAELAILDGFDAVILDDIGYVQQSRDEMEVLFTPRRALRAAQRDPHEQPRVQRVGPIFKDPMTTAAAIGRLVHHSVILEMTGTSVRAEHAQSDNQPGATSTTETTPALPPPPATTTPTSGATPTTTTRSTSKNRGVNKEPLGKCNCRRWVRGIDASQRGVGGATR